MSIFDICAELEGLAKRERDFLAASRDCEPHIEGLAPIRDAQRRAIGQLVRLRPTTMEEVLKIARAIGATLPNALIDETSEAAYDDRRLVSYLLRSVGALADEEQRS